MKLDCPYAGKCGACKYTKENYEESLAGKLMYLEKLLKEFVPVNEIVGMDEPFNYRNKIHTAFASDRSKKIVSGIFEEGTHKVVPTDSCKIEDEEAAKLSATIKKLMPGFKMLPYDEDRHTGFLRYTLVRVGKVTGEVMLVLVTGTNMFPGKKNFVKAMLKEHPEITTIVWNINDKNTSMVLGKREEVIYGKGFIVDELCGKKFKISAKSFYQINHDQTELLYGKGIEYAGLAGNERVFDAYSGIGTIGIIAADKAKEVISVELNKDAVADANVNAKLNGVTNIKFFEDDAGRFMTKMAEKGEKVDVLFMDPPRSGSSEEFIKAIGVLKPKKIVYISCGPESLARDLKGITKLGYKCEKATAYDLFPWTEHVESCMLLERVSNRKADSYVKLNVKMEDYYRIKDAEGGEADG